MDEGVAKGSNALPENERGQDVRPDSGVLPTRPSITLDVALYESYLEGSDLSEDDKREFLETLWNIVISFVDLGFEVHPVQLAQEDAKLARDEACGQNPKDARKAAPDLLSSWNTNSETKRREPADAGDNRAERSKK